MCLLTCTLAAEAPQTAQTVAGGVGAAETPASAAADKQSLSLAAKLKHEARSLSSLLKAGAEGYGDEDRAIAPLG